MKSVLRRLWNDDDGAVLASEFVFVVTLLGIGVLTGLTAVRDSVNQELTELSNSILSLSQGYYVSGQVGCCAITDGSEAVDRPGFSTDPQCTNAVRIAVVDNMGCN